MIGAAPLDDARLELLLRRELRVDDPTLDRVVTPLVRGESGADATAARPRAAVARTLLPAAAAAAALVVGTATLVHFGAPTATDPGGPHAAAVDLDGGDDAPLGDGPGSGFRVAIRHDPAILAAHGDDDPRRLGNLLANADLIVTGEVEALAPEVVLRVDEVLLGDAPGATAALRGEDGATYFACAEPLSLEVGERGAWFLVRDATDPRRYEVLFGDAGANPLPMEGWFELDDLRAIIAIGAVSPTRVREWVDARGFEVATRLPWHFGDLDTLRLPLEDVEVQRALADRVAATDLSTLDTGDLVLVAGRLTAATFDAMPESTRQALREQYDRVLAGVNGPFRAADLLRPFARRKEPWAYPRVRALLDDLNARMDAAPRADYGAAQHRELLALLHALDPDDAVRRAWAAAARLPDAGYESRGRLLDLLLEWDPPRAAEEIVATARAQWDGRAEDPPRRVWIDLVVRAPGPDARALAREILGDPTWTADRYAALWRPPLHRAILDHAVDVRDLRDVFTARCAVPADALDDQLDRLLCLAAAGGPVPKAPLAPWIARIGTLDRWQVRELAEAVERAFGVTIRRQPVMTRPELERAVLDGWSR